MTTQITWTRVYRRGGKHAHLRELSASLCPALARHEHAHGEGWYGTGSQDEYDRAARVPLCPHCAQAAGMEEAPDGQQ